MIKLMKYLKKSAGYIVLIIALLFLQAYCDLSLPDYTSKIINVGIQQKGIEDSVPDKLRDSTLQNLQIFMDEDQKKEFHSILEWADETKSFVVFGEEDQTYGRFETDIFVEENAYFELGIFSARVVRSYYEEQLVITAGVEKEWDAAMVRPFLWKVNGGQCSLEEFGYMHDNKLTEDFAISVKPGEYHRFGYETDGKQIRLYVDGELQKEISIPYGPAFVSVVTDTKDEIIIKAVNFAGDVDPVSITLDCQVQGDYTVTLLSGEKGDENSFEEPEKVKNITVNMHGASSEFVYEAPPYSVSALRLKKCEAF